MDSRRMDGKRPVDGQPAGRCLYDSLGSELKAHLRDIAPGLRTKIDGWIEGTNKS